MAHSWLQRQKKAALLELSVEAGLPQEESLLKDEILANLETYLDQNATTLSRMSVFEDYYGKRAQTPARGRPPRDSIYVPSGEDNEVKSVVKTGGRRATKIKQEPEDDDPVSSPVTAAVATATSSARRAVNTVSSTVSSALSPSGQLTARTPATRAVGRPRRRSEVPGPPSPADVADVVEYESRAFVQKIEDLYAKLGVNDHIQSARDTLSSVTAVQMTFLLIEAIALQRHLMPWQYVADVPSTPFTSSFAVFAPDLFILLTGYYWSTTFLWASTSIFVPALFGYFYNLTIRDVKRGSRIVPVARYASDPLTFHVVKALTTWLVYNQGVNFGGWINPIVAERIDLALYGGHTATLIGSAIGALAALYEAAQKKHVASA